MNHAQQVEHMADQALELRASIGISGDGYAHVHVANPHDSSPIVYVALPGGTMMSVGGASDELTLRRRADFIAAAINERLSPLPPRPLPHQSGSSLQARPEAQTARES